MLIVVAGFSAYLSAALLALLVLVDAGAGTWSLLSGKDISCACFGSSKRRLGWPQLALLPLRLTAAWSVTRVAAEAAAWIDQLALAPGDAARTIVMTYDEVIRHLDAFVTPLAIAVVNGKIGQCWQSHCRSPFIQTGWIFYWQQFPVPPR